jgi:hypothetical protein
MRKGWLYYSIMISLAGCLIAFTMLALTSGVYGASPHDQPGTSNRLFVLTLMGLLILEFAGGMLSFLCARPATGKAGPWLKASLVAGLLPAVAFCSFLLNNWRNSPTVYAPGTSTQISEPAPFFIVCGLLVFFMAVCLLASVAGGRVAQVVLKS